MTLSLEGGRAAVCRDLYGYLFAASPGRSLSAETYCALTCQSCHACKLIPTPQGYFLDYTVKKTGLNLSKPPALGAIVISVCSMPHLSLLRLDPSLQLSGGVLGNINPEEIGPSQPFTSWTVGLKDCRSSI